jgi:geranylgeranylglycerol-phosphate geranylgeranyltransferase
MIKVWVSITRPLNILITACAVFIGALLTGTLSPLSKIILALCSAAFICAGGNVLNDYFDVDIDKINKPRRPLPSGKIQKNNALIYSVTLLACGFLLAFFISLQAVLLAAIAVVLLVSYNAYVKRRTGIIGNMLISMTGALPIAYGGIATGKIHGILFPTVFAFLLHLGREIIKDIEDVTGDRLAKSCSIPTRFTPQVSYYIGFIPLFFLVIITPLPFIFKLYNVFYLPLVLLLVNLPLLISFFFFRKKLDTANLHKLSNILKLEMVFGLLSLIIGTL